MATKQPYMHAVMTKESYEKMLQKDFDKIFDVKGLEIDAAIAAYTNAEVLKRMDRKDIIQWLLDNPGQEK